MEGFVSNMEEFLQAIDDEIKKLEGQQQKPIKLCSQMLHSSLFPPGQLALAALRIANGVLGVVDFDRYLEKNVSQPKSERTRLQTSQICLMTSNLWEKRSKHKSHKSSSDAPNGPRIVEGTLAAVIVEGSPVEWCTLHYAHRRCTIHYNCRRCTSIDTSPATSPAVSPETAGVWLTAGLSHHSSSRKSKWQFARMTRQRS
ncbi:unnamed protein product [Brassica oleracea var. botrytis]|uniref:Uncharacterized protein n=1 Tax=Brassica oleracea TaxID=3712 RepID=A0A3P6DZY9_BRAOL|nr:unnamed protein product [Brassica oleracea]